MGFIDFLSKLFGNKSQRDLKEITPWVERIQAVYPEIDALSNDELRERDQATYSVAVNANYTAEPIASSSLSIHFSTSREKADQLKARAYEILRSMAAGGITQDEFKKVHVPLTLDEAEREKQAGDKIDLGVWIALLNSYAETGGGPLHAGRQRGGGRPSRLPCRRYAAFSLNYRYGQA